ncbi:MAG: UDP-N-acetylmuramate dehydrogenase [Prevotella sp.]|nr:UDP-N-acetylmuramate dehydrogenase [Prevotella sp.]
MKDEYCYGLLPHNTFGIDARCRRFVEFGSAEEARHLALTLTDADRPLLVIGSGSNLLLTSDFEGTVIHSAILGKEVLGETTGEVLLRVGSGEEWDGLVAWCVAQGLHGAENLSLIPGEVGASAVQNIGAYGAEVCELIDRVEAVSLDDGQLVTIPASDCRYGYRQSRFKEEWKGRFLITHVVYRLHRDFIPRLDYGNIRSELLARHIEQPTAEELRQVIIDIRRQKLPDPAVEGNAGSFFMNPVVPREQFNALLNAYPQMPHYPLDDGREKIPAAWLIDQCGWKGRTLGRAGVHSRQALVLVNKGGATGADVVALCEAICHDVSQRFGIDLKPEVNII